MREQLLPGNGVVGMLSTIMSIAVELESGLIAAFPLLFADTSLTVGLMNLLHPALHFHFRKVRKKGRRRGLGDPPPRASSLIPNPS